MSAELIPLRRQSTVTRLFVWARLRPGPPIHHQPTRFPEGCHCSEHSISSKRFSLRSVMLRSVVRARTGCGFRMRDTMSPSDGPPGQVSPKRTVWRIVHTSSLAPL